ncbi:hypothetical protein ACO2Q0_02795 [Phenylobacterium sp. VNQ135]|uniref:hypothetical protein n=1 Tax=Phenylobacterium sp. VNQ135 TaxID=3400922 RepID=UPI003C03514F
MSALDLFGMIGGLCGYAAAIITVLDRIAAKRCAASCCVDFDARADLILGDHNPPDGEAA